MAEKDDERPFGFPFQPYSIQLQLMKAIYDSIEQRKVAILESPTGTGKSLSAICAVFICFVICDGNVWKILNITGPKTEKGCRFMLDNFYFLFFFEFINLTLQKAIQKNQRKFLLIKLVLSLKQILIIILRLSAGLRMMKDGGGMSVNKERRNLLGSSKVIFPIFFFWTLCYFLFGKQKENIVVGDEMEIVVGVLFAFLRVHSVLLMREKF